MKKRNKLQNKLDGLFKQTIYKYKEYCLQYNVSLYFAVHYIDMIKNAYKTQNLDVLKEFIKIFDTIPYNKKIEQQIINSIRYENNNSNNK